MDGPDKTADYDYDSLYSSFCDLRLIRWNGAAWRRKELLLNTLYGAVPEDGHVH